MDQKLTRSAKKLAVCYYRSVVFPVVLFDLNGILVDDEDLHEAAFRKALNAAGFTLNRDEYLRLFAGRTDSDGFNAFVNSHPDESIDVASLSEEKAKFYAVSVDNELSVFDDAIKLVHHLKESGHMVGLVTGSTATEVEVLLEEIALHGAFDVIVTGDDVHAGKPSAEPFLLAARTLGVAPEDCVVIEDSPAGLSSARRAGMRSIAVKSSHDSAELHDADVIVNAASEIDENTLVSH